MDYAGQVDHVERALADLVEAVAAGPLDTTVPTCPDYSVDQLAHHVGTFCGFWAHVLCEGTARPKTHFVDFEVDPSGITEPAARAGWVAAAGADLVAELRAAAPETPVWTWYPPDQSAAFVARRCSHELTVHRVDAQLARGEAGPIDAPLAVDGIEEIFVLLSQGGPDGERGHPGAGQTLQLHGTDYEPADWLLTLAPEGVQVERVHAEADLALSGSVGDLELVLYQRPPVGEVGRLGDESILGVFYGEFTFG
jgi:uncharacterized protein (TIGR03083 family)